MIETDRLILRAWLDSDIEPFRAMCNDPEVMRYLGPPLSRADAVAARERMADLIASHGYCFWAIERKDDRSFLGFCGLKPGPLGTPIQNRLEIGWRLARMFWGKGYAFEAARASIEWAWEHTDETEIHAMTVAANTKSWTLMERLGMVRDGAGDFDHPAFDEGNPLRRHILYRIARTA